MSICGRLSALLGTSPLDDKPDKETTKKPIKKDPEVKKEAAVAARPSNNDRAAGQSRPTAAESTPTPVASSSPRQQDSAGPATTVHSKTAEPVADSAEKAPGSTASSQAARGSAGASASPSKAESSVTGVDQVAAAAAVAAAATAAASVAAVAPVSSEAIVAAAAIIPSSVVAAGTAELPAAPAKPSEANDEVRESSSSHQLAAPSVPEAPVVAHSIPESEIVSAQNFRAQAQSNAVLKQHLEQTLLNNLNHMSDEQLRTEINKLAYELIERSKWEGMRLHDALLRVEADVAKKYLETMDKQR
jgi:hypothetical protein